MGKTIILTNANIEENSNNTKLVYNFPSGGYTFKNDMIALNPYINTLVFLILQVIMVTIVLVIHGLMGLNTLLRFQMDTMKLAI